MLMLGASDISGVVIHGTRHFVNLSLRSLLVRSVKAIGRGRVTSVISVISVKNIEYQL
jgi:hypothetical protein